MSTPDDPLVTTAPVDEVLSAIEAVDLEAAWSEVAADIRIALPRHRALPDDIGELPTREYAPGIRAGLGLDIGPAMLFVRDEQLSGWGVSADQAFGQALANVRTRVDRRRQFALIHERIADVPTIAFQSREGWAASLLLLPDLLVDVLGDRSGLILAPMRDLIISLPLDAEPEFALWLLDEFAAVDMNALALPPFALVDGQLHHALKIPTTPRRTAMAN